MDKPKPMKVYSTKYALTRGIEACLVEKATGDNTVRRLDMQFSSYLHKNEWHTDWILAVAYAGVMRMRKIRALEKQIAKLKALEFREPAE